MALSSSILGSSVFRVQYRVSILSGSGQDRGDSIAIDSRGNQYIVGQTASSGAGLSDAFIVKYSPKGALVWQKTFGGLESDVAGGVVADLDDNIYVVGATQSEGQKTDESYNRYDFFIVKYDQNGNIIWQKILGHVEADEAF